MDVESRLTRYFADRLKEKSIFGDMDVIAKSLMFEVLVRAVDRVIGTGFREDDVYAYSLSLVEVRDSMAREFSSLVIAGKLDLFDFDDEEEATIRGIMLGRGDDGSAVH